MNLPAIAALTRAQIRHFGRLYRCIAYNARGYPPSDVPDDVERYSQDRARDDIRAVLDALKIDKAHIVGLSMGGFATLHFGFTYPQRARSLVIAGCGYGAIARQAGAVRRGDRSRRGEFESSAWRRQRRVTRRRRRGCNCRTKTRGVFGSSSNSWRAFEQGAALTMRGVQKTAAVAVRACRQDQNDRGANLDHDRG